MANHARTSHHARRLDGEPILVDLETEQTRTLLALDSAEDRAFSVGASAHADVRISGRRVPAVAFYLERRSADIWLVPAYHRGALLVNGVAVSAPRRLGRRAVVEVSGVQAFLDIGTGAAARCEHGDADDSGEAKTELSPATRRSRRAYLESLPGADDRTLIDDRDSPRDSALRLAPAVASRAASEPPARVSAELAAYTEHSGSGAGAAPSTLPRARGAGESPPSHRRSPPHLWALLALRPFETVAFVFLVGLLILVTALAATLVLRG